MCQAVVWAMIGNTFSKKRMNLGENQMVGDHEQNCQIDRKVLPMSTICRISVD